MYRYVRLYVYVHAYILIRTHVYRYIRHVMLLVLQLQVSGGALCTLMLCACALCLCPPTTPPLPHHYPTTTPPMAQVSRPPRRPEVSSLSWTRPVHVRFNTKTVKTYQFFNCIAHCVHTSFNSMRFELLLRMINYFQYE